MAVSGFFDPRAAMRARNEVPPRFQFGGRDGRYSYVIGERDAHTGRDVAKHTPLVFGVKAIVDLGTAEREWLSYSPYDDSHLVPIHRPVNSESPGESYSLVVRVALYIEGYGMAQWTIGGMIAQNAAFAAFLQYQRSTEGASGKIPVWQFGPNEQVPIRSRNGELPIYRIAEPRAFHTKFRPDPIYAPVYTLGGWVRRDAKAFGPRLIPPPQPMPVSEAIAAPGIGERQALRYCYAARRDSGVRTEFCAAVKAVTSWRGSVCRRS